MMSEESRKLLLRGRVIWVRDGAACMVRLPDRRVLTVRLYGVEAPGNGMPFCGKSRAALISLARGKEAEVVAETMVSPIHVMGWVFVGKMNVNQEMVRRGAAFHFEKYAPGERGLQEAQAVARASRLGLWGDEEPMPLRDNGPNEFTGRVAHVLDGDSFLAFTVDDREVEVRMRGIDAPEKSQKFGMESRAILASLLYGKQVRVVHEGIDSYHRFVGMVYAGDMCVNAEMLRRGAVWLYSRYAPDTAELALAQQKAREAHLGLWADPHAMAPWNYRKRERKGRERALRPGCRE